MTASLDDYIAASTQGAHGPCKYVRATTPEQRTAIAEKVEQGLPRWRAFQRWLSAQGVDVADSTIKAHYERMHADDR